MIKKRLGQSNVEVSPVAMGCWPIAGMTTLDVNDHDSIATIESALASGIDFFDTAYAYGASGESERLLGRVKANYAGPMKIATKCGVHWDSNRERVFDCSIERISSEFEESLARLGAESFDVYYLHAHDGRTPIAHIAEFFAKEVEKKRIHAVGVSNLNVPQMDEFAGVCPIDVIQPPYNMLQRDIESDLLPWCQQRGVAVACYWPLMKGLLSGAMQRDFVFRPGDGRAKYPMFQGIEWQRNQDFLDELRGIAAETGVTVSQLVISWTIQRPGITVVLCGAKRPAQIEESAGAMKIQLTSDMVARIDQALERRGKVTKIPF